jgi:dihydroxyacetone kinase
MATIGIALSTCTVPGCPKSTRLDGPIIEVGMGIHGEAGREQIPFPEINAADTIANILLDSIIGNNEKAILPHLITSENDNLVLLVNNLGGTPLIELYIVARCIILQMKLRGKKVVRIFIGAFMTAFEMAGVSLTIMRVNDKLLEYIDDDVDVSTWIKAMNIESFESLHDRQIIYSTDNYSSLKIQGEFRCNRAIKVIKTITEKIIEIEPELTQYDMICGDGDCGVVMRAGAQAILKHFLNVYKNKTNDNIDTDIEVDAAEFCDDLAGIIGGVMGGTSGALLEIMLRAMAGYFSNKIEVTENIEVYSCLILNPFICIILILLI